jgi:hypothetical protein
VSESLDPEVRKRKVSEALELRRSGLKWADIADRLGVSVTTLSTWVGRVPKTAAACIVCGEPLNNSPDALDGWCREELVADLVRCPADRKRAIGTLRRAGHSKDSIAALLAGAEVALTGGAG